MAINQIKTFNNVLDTLVSVCQQHPWINTATHGDAWEISPAGNVVYPLAMVVPTSVQALDKQVQYNFNVMCMDLVEPGEGVQEKRVLSQTCSALLDIISYFKRGGLNEQFSGQANTPRNFTNTNAFYDYTNEISTEFTLEPFTEKFTDNVSGWNMQFSITMAHDYSVCFWDNFKVNTITTGATMSDATVSSQLGGFPVVQDGEDF
tara:strand:- start:1585 stop:2199 length:615 start_codon:yes stop_codon:yes gene_type:complete